jgi:hypothetical protein
LRHSAAGQQTIDSIEQTQIRATVETGNYDAAFEMKSDPILGGMLPLPRSVIQIVLEYGIEYFESICGHIGTALKKNRREHLL